MTLQARVTEFFRAYLRGDHEDIINDQEALFQAQMVYDIDTGTAEECFWEAGDLEREADLKEVV